MSKLKTLKDLPSVIVTNKDGRYLLSEGEAVGTDILKAEIIKWIKNMKDNNQIEKLFDNPNELFYAIEKFKQFFNLTEEDLA